VSNQATFGSGGAILDQSGVAVLRNCILWSNTAGKTGPQIYSRNNATSVTYSDVEGGWSGTGNINSTPDFLLTGSHPYDISEYSPCKDVGNNADVPPDVGDVDWDNNTTETLPLDLALGARIFDSTVDLGAYEGPIGTVE